MRRRTLLPAAAAAAVIGPAAASAAKASGRSGEDGPVVEVPNGRLRGKANDGVLTFHNIPYARAGRFQPPEPAARWSGVRDAVARGPICPQGPGRLAFSINDPPSSMSQSEDCLNLSITTPGVAGRRPVIVWIHGGAYMIGGGETDQGDAEKLAAEGGVVVVAVSYRLGLFGYLWQSDPGRRNLGLLDQLAALRWVVANIERFGGDPENITLAGQSAGGHSIVGMLERWTGTRPVRRVVLQSSPISRRIGPDDAKRVADAFHAALGRDAETAAVAQVLAAQGRAAAQGPPGMPIGPVLGSGSMDRRGLDIMIGWARDDSSTLIALRESVSKPGNWFGEAGSGPATAEYTRTVFSEPAEALAASTPADAKTYLYRLDLRPEGSPFGACHCLDLPLLFGDEASWRGSGMLGRESWSTFESLGRRVRAAWAAFATTGDPSAEGGWDWRAWSGGAAGAITHLNL